jgi:hypothetical protein
MRRLVASLLALLLLGSIAGCSGETRTERFNQSLAQTAAQTRPVQLSTLVDFPFDRVLLFRDYWWGPDVNAAVGLHVMGDGEVVDEDAALWVFVRGNELVSTITTGYTGLITSLPAESRWTGDVWLVPSQGGLITLSETPGS